MNPDRRDFLTLGIGALAVSSLPFALRGRPSLVRRRVPVMGTVAEIAVPARNEIWAHRAIDAAVTELRRVETSMTRFDSGSDVGRLNAAASRWVPVSEDTGTVLREAQRWASISDGRFDPAMGSIARLWDVSERDEPPEPGAVGRFADQGLWTALEIDQGRTVNRARLTSIEASVDLGGIAKGFAVDAAARALRDHGVFDGLVNVGGDLVGLGVDASGEPWRIGVRSPHEPDEVVVVLSIADEAVATSGDYLQFFQHGGRRYHHLIDPTTGAPRQTTMRSLTMRADHCVDADAGATALYGAPAMTIERIAAQAGGGIRVIHQIEEVTP